MNCAECQDNLVARLEGLLDPELSRQCQAHLGSCAGCRAEYAAVTRLQQRLAARGRLVAEVAMVEPVMRQVRKVQGEHTERNSFMTKLFTRWGFGLGAAAGATAIILVILLASPKAQATAAEVMAKGARAVAKLTSVHLQGQLRTLPADNFSYIAPDGEFFDIELWKQFQPDLKWRIDKPGRVAVMDGQTTLLYFKAVNQGVKLPQPTASAFDTRWLHQIADVGETLTTQLNIAQAKGWKMDLSTERAPDGRKQAVVTIETKSGLPDADYLQNKFFDTSDTRWVYRFDDESERLVALQIYLRRSSGDVLIFDLNRIDYNQPIGPAVFQPDLPANVAWEQDMQILPDNEKYAAMTAEQAARAYFEALSRADWVEAERFRTLPVTERVKQIVVDLEILNLGTAFTSQGYDPDGRFVPYEIKLKSGDVLKHNLALKKDPKTRRWFVDGGGF